MRYSLISRDSLLSAAMMYLRAGRNLATEIAEPPGNGCDCSNMNALNSSGVKFRRTVEHRSLHVLIESGLPGFKRVEHQLVTIREIRPNRDGISRLLAFARRDPSRW